LLLILSAPLVSQAQTPVIADVTVNLAKGYIALVGHAYAPAPDGLRFLVNLDARGPAPPLTVVLDWRTLLKRSSAPIEFTADKPNETYGSQFPGQLKTTAMKTNERRLSKLEHRLGVTRSAPRYLLLLMDVIEERPFSMIGIELSNKTL
jgi:hypothetical protein